MQETNQAPTNLFSRLFDLLYMFLLAAVALFLNIMWFMCMEPARFIELMKQNAAMFIDFFKVYGLSKMVYAGLGSEVYLPAAQYAFLKNLIPARNFEAFVFLPYPPFVYALFGPFAALPMVPAYAVWSMATAALGLLSLLYLRMQVVKNDSRSERLLLLFLFLSSVFHFNNFFLGQAAWLITGLTCLFFVALMRDDDTACGVLLGLCTIKFQFLLLLGTPLLVMRKWRAIITGGLVSTVFLFLAVFSIGLKNVLNYPAVLSVQELLHPNIPMMINLRGFLFVASPATDHLNALCCGIMAVVCIFSFWMSARSRQQKWKAISLSTVAYLVFSPHAFVYDGLLLAVPTAITLQRLSLSKLLQMQKRSLKLFSLTLCVIPVVSWVAYFGGNEVLGRVILCANIFLLIVGLVDYLGTFPTRQASLGHQSSKSK